VKLLMAGVTCWMLMTALPVAIASERNEPLFKEADSTTNSSFDSLETIFINGRGWIRHLSSLMMSPSEWTSVVSVSELSPRPANENSCQRIFALTIEDFEQCSVVLLSDLRQQRMNDAKKKSAIIEQAYVLVAAAESSRDSFAWTSWLRMASLFVLADDYEKALLLLQRAKKSLKDEQVDAVWKRDRVAIFEKGLIALIERKQQKILLAEENRSEDIQTVENDAVGIRLLSLIDGVIIRLQQDSSKKSFDSHVSVKAEDEISEIIRKKWIIRNDKAELASLRDAFRNSEFRLGEIGRLNNLINQSAMVNKEWQSLLVPIFNLALKTELLTRSDGLALSYESWLAFKDKNRGLLRFDDDTTLHNHHLILNELTSQLSSLLDDVGRWLKRSEDRMVIDLLSSRLKAMVSEPSRTLNESVSAESLSEALIIKNSFTAMDQRLRQLNAALASMEFHSSLSAKQSADINGLVSEHYELLKERKIILDEFASQSIHLIPNTLKKYSLLKTNVARVRKSLVDFFKVVNGLEESNGSKSQVRLFSEEVLLLLDKLQVAADAQFENKKTMAKNVSITLKGIKADLEMIKGDFSKFLKINARDLKPQFISIINAIDSELKKDERRLLVREQQARSRIRESLNRTKREQEWIRDRVLDARRIRGEGWEWRTAQ